MGMFMDELSVSFREGYKQGGLKKQLSMGL